MTYSIKRSVIGRRRVPCFSVVDDRGFIRCNESSEALAKVHIQRLEEAEKRIKERDDWFSNHAKGAA